MSSKRCFSKKRFTRLKQECLKFAAHFRTVLHSAIKLTADPMTVVTEAGLAGQLIHVAPNSSQVQLIQDKNQEVPVLFTTSHVRGIVRGSGDGSTLQSRDLPFSDKIKVGEKVVTSGLDGIYPKGIPVGVVTKVEPGDSGSYINVTVASPKSIGTSEYVLVLYVDTKVELPDLDEEEDAGDGQVRRKPRR